MADVRYDGTAHIITKETSKEDVVTIGAKEN
jgi:hypothetical protein